MYAIINLTSRPKYNTTCPVNSIVRHHNRTVYSSQTIHHVAEQIDRLYWASGEPDVHTGEAEDGLVGREVNLRDAEYALA